MVVFGYAWKVAMCVLFNCSTVVVKRLQRSSFFGASLSGVLCLGRTANQDAHEMPLDRTGGKSVTDVAGSGMLASQNPKNAQKPTKTEQARIVEELYIHI